MTTTTESQATITSYYGKLRVHGDLPRELAVRAAEVTS